MTASIQVNQWRHLAYTWDGAVKKLYMDGNLLIAEAATGTLTPIDPGNEKLAIGARYTLTNQFFQGAMDNVRIHHGALEQAELGYFTDSPAVPEPTSFALWSGLGVMGLIAARRRRKVA